MDKRIFYKLDNNALNSFYVGDGLYEINKSSLYIKELNVEKYIIVNSFKNTCIVIDKDIIENCQGVPYNVYKCLETPNEGNRLEFEKMIEKSVDTKTGEKELVSFIFTITYACNHRCKY